MINVKNDARTWGMAVYAIIRNQDGCVLLLQRSPDSRMYKLFWDLPGGKLGKGEAYANGLHREVREETRLEIEMESLAGSTEFAIPAGRTVALIFHVRHTSAPVEISDEHVDFAWVPPNELSRYPLCDHFNQLPNWLSKG